MLDAGTSTIYLCGNIFSVPARVRNKKYIGVLDPPVIKIRANSQAELDDKNISFENVILPFDKPPVAEEKVYTPINQPSAEDSRMQELRDTFEVIFGIKEVWGIVTKDWNLLLNEPTPAQKKAFIRLVCGKGYNESDIVHLRIWSDRSAGWALTKDSFCVSGDIKIDCGDIRKVFYKDFKEIWSDTFVIVNNEGRCFYVTEPDYSPDALFGYEIFLQIGQFLGVVKD